MTTTKLVNEQVAILKKAIDELKYAYQHMSPNLDKAVMELKQAVEIFRATLREHGVYTAWELAGDWWWTEKYRAQIIGGRVLWWEAQVTKNYDRVRLARLVPGNSFPALKQINRYVDPYTLCVLVPIEEGDKHE